MVSPGDRRKMAVIAASLAEIESDEIADTRPGSKARRDADAFRADYGIAPLRDDDVPPEEEFYRRARALGFRRLSR